MTHGKTFASLARARVLIPSDVIVRQVADEAVILNLSTEQYFGLDPVGRRLLAVLEESVDVRSGVAKLLDEYNVDEATLEQDVAELLSELEGHGLINLSTTGVHAEPSLPT